MNNTNPFIPQGSLLEQKNKKRARFKAAAVTILLLNIALISPMLLIQACKHSDQTAQNEDTNSGTGGGGDFAVTNQPTNVAPPLTNPIVSTNLLPPTMGMTTSNVPPTPPTPAVSSDVTEYVVLPKDTYTSIAKKFAPVTVKALEAANPDVPPTKLMPGKKIKIPAATAAMAATGGASVEGDNVYVVKAGDNLINIARRYSTTVKAIQELNGMSSTSIKAGQKLKVPVKTAAAGMPAETAPATTASNGMPAPAPIAR